MKHLHDRWSRYFFTPQTATNLGVSRVLFFGGMFLLYWHVDFSLWSTVSDVFWMPIGAFRELHLPVLPPTAMGGVELLWKLALALSCVGLSTRTSTFTAFLLGFYLLGLPHNMGKTHHQDAPLVFVLGILAFSRCGDAWSVDRLLSWRRSPERRPDGGSNRSGEYAWPIRTIWVLMALVFFAAGYSKIANAGLSWVFSENLAIILVTQHYFASPRDPLVDWGLHLAAHPWLYSSVAGLTVLLEVGYPLTLISRWARWTFMPGMLLALLGIRVLMGPSFEQFLLIHFFWVPWNRLPAPAAAWGRIRGLYSRPDQPLADLVRT